MLRDKRKVYQKELLRYTSWILNHRRLLGLVVILSLIGFQMYKFKSEGTKLENQVSDQKEELKILEEENKKIENDITYLKNPHNALKEVRSQFNYKRTDERLLIVVPQKTTTTTSN